MTFAQPNFFGEVETPFTSAKERYGVWPTTVWDLDFQDAGSRAMKADLNDSATRDEAVDGTFGYQAGASRFSPVLAQVILNAFSPEASCQIFDPFAGGGTRAVVAGLNGFCYTGTELRADEVASVEALCRSKGITVGATEPRKHGSHVSILHGCATQAYTLTGKMRAQFIYTCPPYYNLEQYGGGPSDLSGLPSYAHFCASMSSVIHETARIIETGCKSVWVVGLHRDKRGTILPMHHDIAAAHAGAGFTLQEEIVVAHRNNGAVTRVGQFEKANKRLVRTHEYVLVFRKEK